MSAPPPSAASPSAPAAPESNTSHLNITHPSANPPRRDDGTGLVNLDPWLEPYSQHLRNRYTHYLHFRSVLDQHGGPTGEMTTGHKYFGLNRGSHDGKTGVWYREWAPAAQSMR